MCVFPKTIFGTPLASSRTGLELVESFIVSDGFRVCEKDQKAKAKAGRIAVEMVQPYQEYRRSWGGVEEWLLDWIELENI